MGNEIYMHHVQRDYWSASTSRSETPRHSSAVSDPATEVDASPPSSSSSTIVANLEYLSYDSTMSLPLTSWTGGVILKSSSLKKFMFQELKIATNKFSIENLIGEGAYAQVFKGWLHEKKLNACKPGRGIPVAVKRFKLGLYREVYQERLAEVNLLGQLHHPNIIKLIGNCSYKTELLLVYEFMALTSLENHLFNRDSRLLTWSIRMKIALQIAKALVFLHRTEINVLHLGVASSTILLDSDYNAKLSGFALAIPGPTGDMGYVSTQLRGTIGYFDPEFLKSGNATAKSDVYSFGVVLLEFVSGRKPFEGQYEPESVLNLVEWAELYLNGNKVLNVLDPHLDGHVLLESATSAFNLAFQCVATKGEFRPNMDQVVTVLEQLQDDKAKGETPELDINILL